MNRCSEPLKGTHLNSVWLEGTLVADPVGISGEDPPAWQFRVQAPRPPEPPSFFLIEAADRAFDGCRPRLGPGRAVRVIGRLREHQDSVKIVGELVEPVGVPT